jgi:hypothetical protein
MRRKLIYLRTEVRFYNEIVPMLLALNPSSNDNGNGGGSKLRNHLPTVHLAEYDLDGLIPEDCPTTFAKQPSPLPPVGGDDEVDDEDDDEDDDGQKLRKQLLEGKGGHILLRSISSSSSSSSSVASKTPDSAYGAYYQDSPITLQQSSACLAALADAAADRRPAIERGRIVLVAFSQPERAVEYGRIVGMLSWTVRLGRRSGDGGERQQR